MRKLSSPYHLQLAIVSQMALAAQVLEEAKHLPTAELNIRKRVVIDDGA